MTFTQTLEATLVFITLTIGVFLMTGSIKLVRARPKEESIEDDKHLLSLHMEQPNLLDAPKRRRGRPRKNAEAPRKPRAHHVTLPPNVTSTQIAGLSEFFRKNQSKLGDRVVLHITPADGPEKTMEIPHLVRWNERMRENLAVVLNGW